jgi:hypothetical protein
MLPQFVNFGVAAFTDDQVSSFVRKQIKEEELAGKILKSIEEEKAEEVRSFVSNPLLLSLYILTFRTNSTIPDKKHLFYRRVYDVLFSEHDTLSKLGYERERKTGLTQEQFQDVLERISFLAFFDGRFSFSRDYTYGLLKHVKAALGLAFENADLLDDLKTAIGIWTEDGGEFSFAHRSMQEYFGACFIKGLKDALKQEIYAKINEKLEQRVGLGNFLSLCAEMDTIAYHEFLMLPALQAVDRRVASARERPIAAASLLFESIILDDNLKIEGFIITRAAGVYITILNFDLTSMSNAMICLSHDRRFQQWVIETNSTTAVKFADLSEQKKQEADDILRKDTLAMREIDSFLSQVTHKIDETKQLLQNVDSNNRKFIDMI